MLWGNRREVNAHIFQERSHFSGLYRLSEPQVIVGTASPEFWVERSSPCHGSVWRDSLNSGAMFTHERSYQSASLDKLQAEHFSDASVVQRPFPDEDGLKVAQALFS